MNEEFKDWYWLNKDSKAFLQNGYIVGDEIAHFTKIAEKAEKMLNKPGYAKKFLGYLAKGYYLIPTPGITNYIHPTESAISCFGSYVDDSVQGILFTDAEIGMMSKIGGGTSARIDLRAKGEPISGGGYADGVMRFVKRVQDTTGYISQKSRRGKAAMYLSVNHKEINEFLTISDRTSEIQDVPFGVVLTNAWLKEAMNGDVEKQKIWAKIIKKKFESGFPYILFADNANEGKPDIYKDLLMEIFNSNLCTEIMLPNSALESFICAISAMQLLHFDEWKNTDAVETLVYFVDTMVTDFINKNKDNPLMARAVRFAERHRAIGIGASGWHSYLQKNMIPVETMEAKFKNVEIFKTLKEQSYAGSEKMAEEYGQAPILQGTKYKTRHTTLNAVAPNLSTSEIFGQWINSIEMCYSNYYVKALAKRKRTDKNYFLTQLFIEKGINTNKIWASIKDNNGSVQHLKNELSDLERAVFKTSIEISPMELVIQNSVRQKYIDQGISFNLTIPHGTPAKEVSQLYIKAGELGLKSLYYQLNQNAAQVFTRKSILDCEGCAG